MSRIQKAMKRTAAMTSLMSVLAVLNGGVAGASSEAVALKVHHMLPSNSHFNQHVIVPWCDKVAKESAGKLKCQIYASMQLGGTPAQLFDQVRDGVADVIWTVPTYQAGRFTKSEVFELPYLTRSAEKASPALWDYIQKNSLDEFKGAKLLFAHVHDGAQLHFGSKNVKTLEDIKGLKVRAPTRIATRALSALGAIPVQMPVPAVPESIAKGVVDGAAIPWEVSTSLKLQEICKGTTETAANQPKVSNTIFVFAMNPAKYNGLSPELKKVIDNNSGAATSRWAGRMLDEGVAPARKLAADRRNTLNVLSNGEFQRWAKATEPVYDYWIKEVSAKGSDGKALLNDARALLKKYND